MTIKAYARYPRTVGELVTAGYAAQVVSAKATLLDDATQTTIAAIKPLGVFATSVPATNSASQESESTVVNFGETLAVIADASLAAETMLVAEAGTGKLLGYSEATYTNGQAVYLIARLLEPVTAADQIARIFVNIQLISVSNPA